MIAALLVASLQISSFDRLIQIPSAVGRHSSIQERCLDEAKKLDRGITVSVGVTDDGAIFAQTRWPQWKFLDPILDGAIARKLPKIRLKIGGGPPHHPTWKALNGGNSWEESNRPPRGEDDALWAKLTQYKQYVIDRAIAKVSAAKMDPKQILEIELGTEPGKGGSGGPWKSAYPFTYQEPYARLPEGTWDDAIHEQLSYEAQRLNFHGLPVLSPAFEFQDDATFRQELETFASPKGEAWRRKVTVWVVNIYANLGGTRDTGLASAVRAFRIKAMMARNWMWRTRAIGDGAKLAIGELGWTVGTLNRKGSNDAQDRKLIGEADRACEEAAKTMGFESVSIYCMSDDDFGLFDKAMRPTPAYDGFVSWRE